MTRPAVTHPGPIVGAAAAALLVALALLTAGTAAAREPVPIERLQSLGALEYEPFHSPRLGRGLHLFTRLPHGYAETSDPLPVVYVLDGGGLLPLLAGQYHYLFLGEELPRLVIVGVSYGATTYREGNMRQTDFTAPAPDRDFWGGAGMFQAVLKDEIIPLIEGRYRIDAERRILYGQSLGGQFVLYSAQTEPGLFWGRVASNPALHRNLAFFLDWHGAEPPGTGKGRLFVSSGELDDPRLRDPALAWAEHWSHRETPWTLEFRTLGGQTHFSAAAESFTQGLKWLFSEDPRPAR